MSHSGENDHSKAKPVTTPMATVRGKVAFVTLNEEAEGKLRQVLSDPGLSTALADSNIITLSKECKRLSDLAPLLFSEYGGLVFVMASGIVLRVLAPLIDSKYTDPAVVVIDDQWRHVVSLLSGHEGGANWLCYQVAKLTGARAVISTGTETNKKYTLGIGCRKGASERDISRAMELFFHETGIVSGDIRVAATVGLKKSEIGLTDACEKEGIPLVYFEGEEINHFDGEFTPSEAAIRQLGIKGVSEPCALLAGRHSRLIKEKTIIGPVTLALAVEEKI